MQLAWRSSGVSTRWLGLTIVVTAIAAGCADQPAGNRSADPPEFTAHGDEPPASDVVKAIENVTHEQSQGAANVVVIVHRVYEYGGFTRIEPIEGAKVVAVDVEFRNYGRDFDLDDVDIIDGKSDINYGSFPQIVELTSDGELAAESADPSGQDDPGPLRVLLIYAIPQGSMSVRLTYWGPLQ